MNLKKLFGFKYQNRVKVSNVKTQFHTKINLGFPVIWFTPEFWTYLVMLVLSVYVLLLETLQGRNVGEGGRGRDMSPPPLRDLGV